MNTPTYDPEILSPQARVIEEIKARVNLGVNQYGTVLRPFNGRVAAQDLKEELIDAIFYLEQLIMETEEVERVESIAYENGYSMGYSKGFSEGYTESITKFNAIQHG